MVNVSGGWGVQKVIIAICATFLYNYLYSQCHMCCHIFFAFVQTYLKCEGLLKSSWCQIVQCQIILCQTIRFQIVLSQIVLSVKLTGVKLSWCHIVRCEIFLGVKFVLVSNHPGTCKIAQMIICAKLNNVSKITHYVWNNTLCIKLHRSPFCVHCDKKSSHSTNLTLALLVE